jgi:catechol 2,3-dioxygenase-like lactoylglutathione lyase family enzyme
MPPATQGILESALYVDSVERSREFYRELFGFQMISDFGETGCALDAGRRNVLLLFRKGASRDIQSPHDGDGELHLAFAIEADGLPVWESWLGRHGIAMEEKRTWSAGGQSIYFRDPDRHLIELVTPGVWTNY